MADSNGICKKNKFGERQHDMRESHDGKGRTVIACYRCGALVVDTPASHKITYDRD